MSYSRFKNENIVDAPKIEIFRVLNPLHLEISFHTSLDTILIHPLMNLRKKKQFSVKIVIVTFTFTTTTIKINKIMIVHMRRNFVR